MNAPIRRGLKPSRPFSFLNLRSSARICGSKGLVLPVHQSLHTQPIVILKKRTQSPSSFRNPLILITFFADLASIASPLLAPGHAVKRAKTHRSRSNAKARLSEFFIPSCGEVASSPWAITKVEKNLFPLFLATYANFSIWSQTRTHHTQFEVVMFLHSENLPEDMPDISAVEPETSHPNRNENPFDTEDDQTNEKNSEETEPKEKRNCGKTGATSEAGRSTCSQNARKHGSCSRVLILPNEDHDAWLDLLSRWEAAYLSGNPLVADFVYKTAAAEWQRIRVQKSYDSLLGFVSNPNVYEWQPHDQKQHDLALRYLTTAERRFQREFRMLEQFYTKHGQPAAAPEPTRAEEAAGARAQEDEDLAADDERRKQALDNLKFVNNETGEWVGKDGIVHPPEPGWKPEPIVPGEYPPDHPIHSPKPLFLQRKRRR